MCSCTDVLHKLEVSLRPVVVNIAYMCVYF